MTISWSESEKCELWNNLKAIAMNFIRVSIDILMYNVFARNTIQCTRSGNIVLFRNPFFFCSVFRYAHFKFKWLFAFYHKHKVVHIWIFRFTLEQVIWKVFTDADWYSIDCFVNPFCFADLKCVFVSLSLFPALSLSSSLSSLPSSLPLPPSLLSLPLSLPLPLSVWKKKHVFLNWVFWFWFQCFEINKRISVKW